jgi:hypothetical protein
MTSGFNSRGAAQVGDRHIERGRRELPVQDLREALQKPAKLDHLAVPDRQNVEGHVVVGVELESLLGLGLDLLRELDLALAALEQRQLADRDRKVAHGRSSEGERLTAFRARVSASTQRPSCSVGAFERVALSVSARTSFHVAS